MHTDPFILFGAQHIITLIIAFSAFIFIPFAIKDKSDALHHTAGISIAVLIFVHEVTNALNAFTFGLPWQEAVPLHLCDMSAISIALYFIYKLKILFNCAFFWGIGGATMAMLTPDIDYQFPHAEFVPFFYGHALVLLGVFFAVICLKERPFFSDVNKVVVISLVLAGCLLYTSDAADE